MNGLTNITHCPRTDSPRRDIGCLHCPFSMKLGDAWTCLFPQEGYGKGGGAMTWLEKYTAYKPMQTTTTTTHGNECVNYREVDNAGA